MSQQETDLVAKFMRLADDEPGAYAIKHSDGYVSGVPDVSFTLNRWTSWLEFKLSEDATPTVRWQHELQRITCVKLATRGTCWLVLYHEAAAVKTTYVLDPRMVKDGRFDVDEAISVGDWDHAFVLDFMREVHRGRR